MKRTTSHLPARTARICVKIALHMLATGPATLWVGRGYDPQSSEHATGRAIDLIVSARVGIMPTPEQLAAGELLAAWLIRHAHTLHVRHIIWRNRIWKRRYPGSGWQPLPGNRKTISDRHDDHIHILLDDDGGTVPADPITTPTTEGDDLMAYSSKELQLISESAIQAQLVQKGRAPSAHDNATALLNTRLGASGPTPAIALQSGYRNTEELKTDVAHLKHEMLGLKQQLAQIIGLLTPGAAE